MLKTRSFIHVRNCPFFFACKKSEAESVSVETYRWSKREKEGGRETK